jgi:DNA (cytosine-5)-methyltransferase 1
MLTHIDAFGGLGAFSLASRKTGKISTIAYCDICEDAQKVYKSHFPEVSIYFDIRGYHPPKGVDIFTGGFPCTGTSKAGRKEGLDHAESAMWFEYLRCIQEGRPRFVIVENPTGLLDRGMGTVLQGLSESGYDAEWQTLTASQFGSPQKRERVFIIAYANDGTWKRAQCWGDQIGEVVERQKTLAKYPSFKPSDDGAIVQFPDELDRVPTGIPKGIRGRNNARALFGRTIDLNCAAVAIKRVLYLHRVFSK